MSLFDTREQQLTGTLSLPLTSTRCTKTTYTLNSTTSPNSNFPGVLNNRQRTTNRWHDSRGLQQDQGQAFLKAVAPVRPTKAYGSGRGTAPLIRIIIIIIISSSK